VHGPGGNAAGVARSIADPVFAEDQCDGSVQHEHARVELVGVRLTVHMGFELAFADLIAFPTKFGLEFGSGHGVLLPRLTLSLAAAPPFSAGPETSRTVGRS